MLRYERQQNKDGDYLKIIIVHLQTILLPSCDVGDCARGVSNRKGVG